MICAFVHPIVPTDKPVRFCNSSVHHFYTLDLHVKLFESRLSFDYISGKFLTVKQGRTVNVIAKYKKVVFHPTCKWCFSQLIYNTSVKCKFLCAYLVAFAIMFKDIDVRYVGLTKVCSVYNV